MFRCNLVSRAHLLSSEDRGSAPRDEKSDVNGSNTIKPLHAARFICKKGGERPGNKVGLMRPLERESEINVNCIIKAFLLCNLPSFTPSGNVHCKK